MRACLRRRNRLLTQGGSEFSGSGANVNSRICTVRPREGHRYFLSLLLTQTPGAESHKDLQNVVGVQCASLEAARCRLVLLLEDIQERKALREYIFPTFVPLTKLFAIILASCESFNPLGLWSENLDSFVSDGCSLRPREPR